METYYPCRRYGNWKYMAFILTIVHDMVYQLGYKRISKIRPNTKFLQKFGFLFNRTEPNFQKFGFGLTKTKI